MHGLRFSSVRSPHTHCPLSPAPCLMPTCAGRAGWQAPPELGVWGMHDGCMPNLSQLEFGEEHVVPPIASSMM